MSFNVSQSEVPLHLLLTSVSAAGHINPLIQLAYYLVESRSWKPTTYVTLAVIVNNNTKGKINLPVDPRIRVVCKGEQEFDNWVRRMVEATEETAADFTPRVSQAHLNWPPISAVIFDFVSCFGQVIAETLKVPCYAYMASPLYFFWSMVNNEEIETKRAQITGPTTYTIPGIGEFSLVPKPPQDDIPGPMRDFFKKMCQMCLNAFKKADGCIANDVQSFYSIEFLASLPPQPLPRGWQVLCCGPLALKDPRLTIHCADRATDEVALFANHHPSRSVLFIALGSCWSLKNQDLVELARGVAATNRPFIFAHRGKTPDDPFKDFAAKDTPALEPTEEDGLPIGFREEVEGRGLIVKWVNQPGVLGHPSIGAFMTHCGWNSIMEGMAFGGVPYLLLPIGGDQQANAEFLGSHLRCGRLVRDFANNEPLERTKVAQVIEEVFNDQDLKDQAQRLHHLVRQESVENGLSEMNAMKFFNRITESKVVS